MRKSKYFMKLICFAISLCIMFPSAYAAEKKDTFGDYGYTEDSLKELVKDAVVLRIDNNRYLYNNIGEHFSTNEAVCPYADGGKIYAPAANIFESFGYDVTVKDEVLTAAKGDSKIVFKTKGKDAKAHMRHSAMYASVKDIASKMGVSCFDNGEIAVISANSKVRSISKSVAEKLSAGLAYKWQNINLGALGYATAVTVHPKNKNILYMVTDVGGMYSFDAEKDRWIQLLNGITPKHKGTGNGRGIALDPNDEDVIYITTGRGGDVGGLYKSYNRGTTWERLPLEVFCGAPNIRDGDNVPAARFAASNIIVDPNASNIVYVLTPNDGLWRSVDYGASWSKMSGFPASLERYDATFIYTDGIEKMPDGRSKVLYAATYYGGLYKSTDAGESFAPVLGSPVAPMRMIYSGGVHYVTADGLLNKTVIGGVFRLEGDKWTDISPLDNGSPLASCAIAVDRNDKNTIFVGGAPYHGNGFWRTKDGGKTWKQLGRYRHMPEILQDPVNDDGIWAPYAGGVYYLDKIHSDNPEIRERSDGVETLVTQKGICLPAQEAPMFLAGMMDHGYRAQETLADRAPESFPSINQCAGIDFCEEDPSYVVRAGLQGHPPTSKGDVTVSYDYGRNYVQKPWRAVLGLNDCAVSATLQANGHPIIMMMSSGDPHNKGEDGGIYRSLDGGDTWEKSEDVNVIRPQASWYQTRCLASDRVDGKTFYYMEEDALWRTKNGGASWKIIKKFDSDISYSTQTVRTLPGIEGAVWHTNPWGTFSVSYDFGDSWHELKTIKYLRSYSYGFGIGKPGTKNPAVYVVGYVDGKMSTYISDDLGKTWRNIGIENQKFQSSVVDVAGDRKYYGRCFVSTGGSGVVAGWPVTLDDVIPVITMDTKSSGEANTPEYAVNKKDFVVSGSVNEIAEVRVNGNVVKVDGYDKFYYNTKLKEGENKFIVEAADTSGNFAKPQEITVRYQPDYYGISLDSTNIQTNKKEAVISGYTASSAKVYVNGAVVDTDENNRFSYTLPIEGDTTATVYAVDDSGVKSQAVEVKVVYDTTAPSITYDDESSETGRSFRTVSGKLSEPGEVMINGTVVSADENLSFSYKVPLEFGENNIRIQARDIAKNASMPQDFKIVRNVVDTANITAKRVTDNFVYDGDVSDWDLTYYCDKLYFGNIDNDIAFGLMWDDEYLYVGVDVEDSFLFFENEGSIDNDCIEFYIDGDNSKKSPYDDNDAQFCYVPNIKHYLAGDVYKFKITEKGYSMEARFKLSDFGITPKVGTVFGFEIDCCDNDQLQMTGKRDGVLGFNADSDSWRDTSKFSNATLIEK